MRLGPLDKAKVAITDRCPRGRLSEGQVLLWQL